MNDLSTLSRAKRKAVSKYRKNEYRRLVFNHNKYHFIGSLLGLVGLGGLLFAQDTVMYGFMFSGGLILYLGAMIDSHRNAFETPLVKSVILSLRDKGHFVTFVLLDRVTGELSAPRNPEDRFARRADHFDMESMRTFRAPRYTEYNGGRTFRMLGETYTIHDDVTAF